MIVPCIVNSWLYWSTDRICSPGWASSARISSAISPPIMKNANDVTRYRIAISFGSVVCSMWANADPRFDSRGGDGCVTIGRGGAGGVVVIRRPPRSWGSVLRPGSTRPEETVGRSRAADNRFDRARPSGRRRERQVLVDHLPPVGRATEDARAAGADGPAVARGQLVDAPRDGEGTGDRDAQFGDLPAHRAGRGLQARPADLAHLVDADRGHRTGVLVGH